MKFDSPFFSIESKVANSLPMESVSSLGSGICLNRKGKMTQFLFTKVNGHSISVKNLSINECF